MISPPSSGERHPVRDRDAGGQLNFALRAVRPWPGVACSIREIRWYGNLVGMRSESFYTTLAQVLPTLLIAIVIELRSLLRESVLTINWIHQLLREPAAADRWQSEFGEKEKFYNRVSYSYFVTGGAFVIGEIAVVVALLVGVGTWFSWVAASLGGLALTDHAASWRCCASCEYRIRV